MLFIGQREGHLSQMVAVKNLPNPE